MDNDDIIPGVSTMEDIIGGIIIPACMVRTMTPEQIEMAEAAGFKNIQGALIKGTVVTNDDSE